MFVSKYGIRTNVRCTGLFLTSALIILFLLFDSIEYTTAEEEWFESCTGRLRVCQDGEEAFQFIGGEEVQVCSKNKLERHTVILTGSAWWSSVYLTWIAQIILEEVLQVPVRIENVNGGKTKFWRFDPQELDVLDKRMYSWDALDMASKGSMDCSQGYRDIYEDMPEDLKANNCTENCIPCAHAMLEIWPNGQDENYQKYIAQDKTVEYGGALGIIGEFGWWATSGALDNKPMLSSFRGLDEQESTPIFKYPLSFGEYCNYTFSDWEWIVYAENPLLINASRVSHFCHYFFSFSMAEEFGISYDGAGDENFITLRNQQLENCVNAIESEFLFYSLCKKFWLTRVDLLKKLPNADASLIKFGFSGNKFLYPGYFISSYENGAKIGVLHSSSCSDSNQMHNAPRTPPWTKWDEHTLGADGYTRFPSYDYDIIQSHGLHLKPYNTHNDVKAVLEVSARLQQDKKAGASPVLISWSRPSEIFTRHKYMLNTEWGDYDGEEFELAPVQLPDYDESCDSYRRQYEDRCSAGYPPQVNETKQCGYRKEILYKAFASRLSSYAPEAYYLLRRLGMTRSQLEHILGAFEYDPMYSELTPPRRGRRIVCDWVRNNTATWNAWIPRTWNEIRCNGEIGPDSLNLDKKLEDADITECSGHGECKYSEGLLRLHPNAGVCVCERGYIGDGCSGLVDPEALNVSFLDVSFLVVIALVFILLAVITYTIKFVNKHGKTSTVLITTNPLFVKIILYSMVVALLGVLTWAGPVTAVHCMLRPIMIIVPFMTVMGVMFVKLALKKMKRATNDEDIKRGLKFFFAFHAVMFLLWFLSVPPYVEHIRLEDRVWEKYLSCEYGSNLAAFEAIFFVFCLILSGATCYFSWDLRHRPTYFNESKDLRLTSIGLTSLGVLTMGVSRAIVSPQEQAKFLINTLTIVFSCLLVYCRLIYPKLYIHFYKPETNTLKLGLFRPKPNVTTIGLGDPDVDIFNQSEGLIVKKDKEESASTWGSKKTKVRPEQAYDPNKRALAYRSPEALLELEEKYDEQTETIRKLVKILHEHRIDPITGEIEKGYLEVVHELSNQHYEEMEEMEDMHVEEIGELKQKNRAKQKALKVHFTEKLSKKIKEKDLVLEEIKDVATDRLEKLKIMEKETQQLRDTVRGVLPDLSEFLLSKQLDQYEAAIREHGFDSTGELLLIDEQDMQVIGMKTGHMRKLERALGQLEVARPLVVLKNNISPRNVMRDQQKAIAEAQDIVRENEKAIPSKRKKKTSKKEVDNWTVGIEHETGKKYWFNKHYEISTWTDPGRKTPKALRQKQDREESRLG